MQLGRPGQPQTLFCMFPTSHKRTGLFPVRSPNKQQKVIATTCIPPFFCIFCAQFGICGACGAAEAAFFCSTAPAAPYTVHFFPYVAPAAPQVSVDFRPLAPSSGAAFFFPTPFWNHFWRSVFFSDSPFFTVSRSVFFSDSFSSFLPFFFGTPYCTSFLELNPPPKGVAKIESAALSCCLFTFWHEHTPKRRFITGLI